MHNLSGTGASPTCTRRHYDNAIALAYEALKSVECQELTPHDLRNRDQC
jgi:hypothetical protein